MCKKRLVYVKELKTLVLDEADVCLDEAVTNPSQGEDTLSVLVQ